jgi:hypothetical protein
MKRALGLLTTLSLAASSVLADVNTKIELDPVIEDFVAGKRIQVNASIEDKARVDVARTYFKSADASNFSFVNMSCNNGVCSGTLPAPSSAMKSMDYLVLVKNGENKVYKTQTFSASSLPAGAETPKYQSAPSQGAVQVKTELPEAPKTVEGFDDNIKMDVAEASSRYGAVAGVGFYSQSTILAASSATGTTSAGTVAATSAGTIAGFSTTTLAVGTAVVVGAAAAGGSSSVTDIVEQNDDSTDTPPVTNPDLTGTWTTVYTRASDGAESVYLHTLTGTTLASSSTSYLRSWGSTPVVYKAGTCTFKDLTGGSDNGNCTWSLDQVSGIFTINYSGGASFGTPAASSTSCTSPSGVTNSSNIFTTELNSNGWTGVWQRK